MPDMGDHTGQEEEEWWENMSKSLYCVFRRKGQGQMRQGKQV
jgi:hypothetical protein